jgi:uncharacterized ion transporter superfamily protein YfcC
MRYARKVRLNPSLSIVADKQEENLAHFLGNKGEQSLEFTPVRKIILVIFALAFAVMIYGVAVLGWWMAEISAVFLASAIIVGLIARMSEEELTSTFINGARDLLGVALIIGIARGIVVIMDKGMITHTILHSAEGLVSGLSTVAFINVMYWLEVVLSFLVPSSSGLAVLTMPIMAPLPISLTSTATWWLRLISRHQASLTWSRLPLPSSWAGWLSPACLTCAT